MKTFLFSLIVPLLISCNSVTGPILENEDTVINTLMYTLPTTTDNVKAIIISSDIKIDSVIYLKVDTVLPNPRTLFYVSILRNKKGYSFGAKEEKTHFYFYNDLIEGTLVKVKDTLICFDRNVYEYKRFVTESKVNIDSVFNFGDVVYYIANQDTFNAVLLKE